MGEEILLTAYFKKYKDKLASFRGNFGLLKNQYPGFKLDTDWVTSLMNGSIEWPEFRRRVVDGTHRSEHCSDKLLRHEGELKKGGKHKV